MKKAMFYRCSGCGNFVMFVSEKTACTPKCCGEPMEHLEPNHTDAALEKHVPEYTVDGDTVTVQVGSTLHPMLPEHHIQFIAAQTEKGIQVHYLEAGEEPKATFKLADDKLVSVYEYCNLHGLWEK